MIESGRPLPGRPLYGQVNYLRVGRHSPIGGKRQPSFQLPRTAVLHFYLQELNLNEAIRVLQLKLPLVL